MILEEGSLSVTFTNKGCFTVLNTYSLTCVSKGAVAPFNVGMGQVQNGCLYLRYVSNLVITTAKSDKMLTEEKPLLFYCKKCPESSASPYKS